MKKARLTRGYLDNIGCLMSASCLSQVKRIASRQERKKLKLQLRQQMHAQSLDQMREVQEIAAQQRSDVFDGLMQRIKRLEPMKPRHTRTARRIDLFLDQAGVPTQQLASCAP